MNQRLFAPIIVSCVIFSSSFSHAEFISEPEISFIVSSRLGLLTANGHTIGDVETRGGPYFTNPGGSTTYNQNDWGDPYTFESRMRSFINAGVGENHSFHAELQAVMDPTAQQKRYQGHNNYSQYDYWRETYLDSSYFDDKFTTRLGKQQVVWGTADGIKLLDIINPTDFRFLNQDPFEDSRITVLMGVAEFNPTDSINMQAIVAESRPNVIPGLRGGGDQGHTFIAKGVDTITGKVDGFLNITPALGQTAAAFQRLAGGFGASNLRQAGGGQFTVQDFVDGRSPFCPGGTPAIPLGDTCAEFLNNVAQVTEIPAPGGGTIPLGGNENRTNLSSNTYNSANPLFSFEYMNKASFATFDTFANARGKYRTRRKDGEPNFGFRFKQSTPFGLNYSLNYYYHYNPNPGVQVYWQDQQGNRLQSEVIESEVADPNNPSPTDITTPTVVLNRADGTRFDAQTDGGATLVFEEFQNRLHSLGASFDAALDFDFVPNPVVLRGEFLFQKDVTVPVIDRNALAIGDITNALRTEKNDFFKYVLGLDVTVFTNLLISTQLIQFVNLDYTKTNKDADGNKCREANCGKYTADPTTLHLTNGLKQGDEVETFGSLFLSKPFGPEQQHRVNNIFIAENDGGYWNKFELEYGFTQLDENLVGTLESNFYFGNRNTTFGQFQNSSNVRIGLKYFFDPSPMW